jgi:hypothetical protein
MKAFAWPLARHPQSRCDAVRSLEVHARRERDEVVVAYRLSGDFNALVVPGEAPPRRQDELWKTTCFEFFLRAERGYFEFNFSPSTAWAAYRFQSYRTGVTPLEVETPAIQVERTPDLLILTATLRLGALAPPLQWRFGQSAVIEEKGGSKSYWALAHPAGKPDFHHPDCFVGELA